MFLKQNFEQYREPTSPHSCCGLETEESPEPGTPGSRTASNFGLESPEIILFFKQFIRASYQVNSHNCYLMKYQIFHINCDPCQSLCST